MALRVLLPYVEAQRDTSAAIDSLKVLDIASGVQLYPRVSTPDQLENVSAQMQQDISFCVAYGWHERLVICDNADLAKSGQLPMNERTAFLKMLGRIQRGEVKTIIAAQVDRFFRMKWGIEYEKFMMLCAEYDVKVVTLSHNRR